LASSVATSLTLRRAISMRCALLGTFGLAAITTTAAGDIDATTTRAGHAYDTMLPTSDEQVQ
jgi:hypothetical protein